MSIKKLLGKRPVPPFLVLLAVLLAMALLLYRLGSFISTDVKSPPYTLVIDAGHGGCDSGAVSADGTRESIINLNIALKLQALAAFYGEEAVMTRTEDECPTERTKYNEHDDLVFRTELANSALNAVLFSIHQNCYPTGQPSGAQVLYARNEESERLGIITHTKLVEYLQPDNRRLACPADKKLYITAHAKCPTILIECGFMSNFSDVLRLKDNLYQTQLSAVLLASFLQFKNTCLIT